MLGKHRKLIPTGGERLIWTGGDGSTLNAFDTPFGKLGGLICPENYMPLAPYNGLNNFSQWRECISRHNAFAIA